LVSDKAELAIILSGSFPKEHAKEVALLVEVTKRETPHTENDTLDQKTFDIRALVIHRVLIWKDSTQMKTMEEKNEFKIGYDGVEGAKHVCLGETRGPTQRWWVDRRETPKMDVQKPPPPRRAFTFQNASQVKLSWNALAAVFGVVGKTRA